MPLNKTAVFIASRFDEFDALRELLKRKIADYPKVQFAPIDLNDGRVSHRPPLAECLAHVRKSEFMILLLGDHYGSSAPNSKKSFTHLEYDEAMREDSGTRVLVFCIGEHYHGHQIRPSELDARLAVWQREVEARHTLGFFDPDTSVEAIADGIFGHLLAALYELRFGESDIEVGEQADDLFNAISGNDALDDSDVATLEARDIMSRGLSLSDDRSRFTDTLQALLHPAAVAALEQRDEAKRAIELADYGSAVKHMRRAVELQPLDLMSNYWLARLYVSLGRKQECTHATELAERAARIAIHDGSPIRAAAAYILAARASRITGRPDEALFYARQAVETAPRYAGAHIEFARNLLLAKDQTAAIEQISIAAKLFVPSLREIYSDPVFRSVMNAAEHLIQEVRNQIYKKTRNILVIERRLMTSSGGDEPQFFDPKSGMRQTIAAAHSSTLRQYRAVQTLIQKANAAVAASATTGPLNSPGRKLQAERGDLAAQIKRESEQLMTHENQLRNLSKQGLAIPGVRSMAAGLFVLFAAAWWWAQQHTLSYVLAVMVGLYFLITGYRYRKLHILKFEQCSALAQGMRQRLLELERHHATIAEQIGQLHAQAESTCELARRMLALFETKTLPHEIRLLPFASIFTCKQGDIIRIWDNQPNDLAKQSSRRIEVKGNLPDWLAGSEVENQRWARLFCVEQLNAERMVLSRHTAYFGHA